MLKTATVLFTFVFSSLVFSELTLSQTISSQIGEALRDRVEMAGIPSKLQVGNEMILASKTLPQFYEARTYQPAWCNDAGSLPDADDLVIALRDASLEGLNPSDYHLEKIEKMLGDLRSERNRRIPPDIQKYADLDFLLTDAFLTYGEHLHSGRVDPENIRPEWVANRNGANIIGILQNALLLNQVQSSLISLLPMESEYDRLRNALAEYRNLEKRGGWPTVQKGADLKKGDKDQRVATLRKRLLITGDCQSKMKDSDPAFDQFDDSLEVAVKNFQKRHGLDTTKMIVDSVTVMAMNVPVGERVRQLVLNMERWRWLPQSLGQRYIAVNIANFELDVIESKKNMLTMRVIVGKAYQSTPVISEKMTYLVLNPYWNVPTSIIGKELAPLGRKDPGYFAKHNMKVYVGWGADAVEVDPATVNWAKVTEKNCRYQIQQEPGAKNSLGRIKFMFPNKFSVYMHDTPSRELFKKNERVFSHGCIRIEKPLDLAEYVLRGDRWTKEKILDALKTNREQTIRLPESIPVYILYFTAWVDENDGTVNFRKDIYDRDKPLAAALTEAPPKP
ncbi:MAG: L,D-transpeptidase family protein [Chlorobiales bacterium]|nr:L,D-transpeptidase family protein [Chlorobiales bacterium]